MRLAKIQATLGPASASVETIRKMVDAGMDGCRVNMSHGSHDSARAIIAAVRQVSAEKRRPIAIAADLRGPKLRIGDVAGGSIILEEGATFELTSEDRLTDVSVASVDYAYLVEDVRPGDPVLLSDGALVLRVEDVRRDRVICRVEKGGELSSRKGVNLPGVPLRVPSLTEKDLDDIDFCAAVGVDFLFLSYARSREHVDATRAALARVGSHIPLVAKIERQEGVDALSEIVDASDGICIARGDLGIETPIGAVPGIQTEAARLCREAGKFVMMGGQVLASMVSSPSPLRAEVTDIVATVRDGLDAIVLSDETAAGSYPVQAVRVAAEVISNAEQGDRGWGGSSQMWNAGSCRLGAVVVVSADGKAVEALAASRCAAPIIAAVERAQVANWLSTWRGVVPVLLEDCSDPVLASRRALEIARAAGVPIPSGRILTVTEADLPPDA